MADELQGLPFFIFPHLAKYVYYSLSSATPGAGGDGGLRTWSGR